MFSGERNNIIVHPSYTEKMPWRSLGVMPESDPDQMEKYARVMLGAFQNAPCYPSIDSIGPIEVTVRNDGEEQEYGGIIVTYHSPRYTKLINRAIADTLGMDDYDTVYVVPQDKYEKTTAEEVKNMLQWQPFLGL